MNDQILSELLDVREFKRLHHNVVIRNLTSNTIIGKKKVIEINELLSDGVKLNTEVNSCAVGHLVSLLFMNRKLFMKLKSVPDFGVIKGTFEVLGRVKSIEDNEKSWTLVIEFTQYDVEKWQKLNNLYIHRQKQINALSIPRSTNFTF